MSCIFRAIASFFFKRIMLGNQVRLQPDFTRDFSLHIHRLMVSHGPKLERIHS